MNQSVVQARGLPEEEAIKRANEAALQAAIERFKLDEEEKIKKQLISKVREEEIQKIKKDMEAQFEQEKAKRLALMEEERRMRDKVSFFGSTFVFSKLA